MHKLVLKGFSFLKNFWYFLKIVCVFCIMMLLLYWIQNLTHAKWEWLGFIVPFLDWLIHLADSICSFSFNFFGALFEFKYLGGIIILIGMFYFMNFVIMLTELMEAGYKSTRDLYKQTEERAMNKKLQDSIAREEKRINKYTVTIHTTVKPKFSHKGMNVDIEKQNQMMNDFIKQKLGVTPMLFENGFMYMFEDFNRIDEILEVLFKVLHGSTPIDYAICIQSGDNLRQLRKLISLKNYGKITMAADTSYRYRFNETHRYQTSQLGIFQNKDTTIEVHEFKEFS